VFSVHCDVISAQRACDAASICEISNQFGVISGRVWMFRRRYGLHSSRIARFLVDAR
jgi:hypothetical protein